MNEIVNEFLLAGDKFMSEVHLKMPALTYSAYGPFTENKKRIKKLKKQVIQDILIKRNKIKLAFSTIGHMDILRIYLEE